MSRRQSRGDFIGHCLPEPLFPKARTGAGPYVGRRVEFLRDWLGVDHNTRGTIVRARGLGRLDIQIDDGPIVTVNGWGIVRLLQPERVA
jgi:hypothetical protein